jgi:hypothetical protein
MHWDVHACHDVQSSAWFAGTQNRTSQVLELQMEDFRVYQPLTKAAEVH